MGELGSEETDARVEVNHECEVGPARADGEFVDEFDGSRIQLPSAALINRGRIKKPVGNHNLAGSQRRLDDFTNELGAAGAKQQQFGFRHHAGGLFAVLENVPDLFTDFRAARFTQHQDWPAAGMQAGDDALDLRGLAAAFAAFKRDELAGARHGRHHSDHPEQGQELAFTGGTGQPEISIPTAPPASPD